MPEPLPGPPHTLRLLLALGACLVTAASAIAQATLPDRECVERLREARIAAETGEPERSRQEQLAALALPSCELAALADLLVPLQAGDLPAEEADRLRTRMIELVSDPDQPLAAGLATYLAASVGSDAEREVLLGALRRRAAAPLPPSTEVLEAVVGLELALGRRQAARSSLQLLLEVAPTEALEWKSLLLDEELGNWAAVVDRATRMLAKPNPPTHLHQLRILGLAHLGRTSELLPALEAIAPPAPQGPEIPAVTMFGKPQPSHFARLLLSVAWALYGGGLDAEAEATFRRAGAYTRGAPDSWEAEHARTVLLHLFGSPEERAAHQRREKARRQSETNPQALYDEASRLLAAGDTESAFTMLQRAAPELQGTHFEEAAWYNLGIAAFRLERWLESAEALDRAIALQPERGASYHQRGIALFQLGRCSEAVSTLERALELQPEKHQAYYYLAQCYRQLGRPEAAERARTRYEAGRD